MSIVIKKEDCTILHYETFNDIVVGNVSTYTDEHKY